LFVVGILEDDEGPEIVLDAEAVDEVIDSMFALLFLEGWFAIVIELDDKSEFILIFADVGVGVVTDGLAKLKFREGSKAE
jgi:hypothetical protein